MKRAVIYYEGIKQIYRAAVEAVKPGAIVKQKICWVDQTLCADNNKIDFGASRSCHVVGFGKAVLDMAVQLHAVVGSAITSGVLSIPHGVLPGTVLTDEFLRTFKIHEGAANNIPDEDSLRATSIIMELVSTLSSDDILLILISGGGSALLASPIESLSLSDKQNTIRLLSKSGANIRELNAVRKKLSSVKGGKLALLAQHPPPTIVTLILSDVIGDPLDVIASGPTVEDCESDGQAWAIITKYGLEESVPTNVAEILKRSAPDHHQRKLDYVHNFLIGNNSTALMAAESYAQSIGFVTCVLSDRVQGTARTIGACFADLARLVEDLMVHPGDHQHIDTLSLILDSLGIDPSRACHLEKLARTCYRHRKNLCLLAGGETTVMVNGRGKGGRNQEMSLAWAIAMNRADQSHKLNVSFLSAGTDGIDGPTDAAGASVHPDLVREAIDQGLDPCSYLENNDSYSFFRALSGGHHHLIVGPTGTNVMDIHILCLTWRDEANEASATTSS